MKITQSQLNILNEKIPINYLWDGFWIDSFKGKTLNISASFDKIYYRDIMIIFKGVSFFNLPYQWRDNVVKLPFMYLANTENFISNFPDESTEEKTIIEWKINDGFTSDFISYYIVCTNVFVFKCKDEERKYDMTYKEPLLGEIYLQKKMFNRIPFLKN